MARPRATQPTPAELQVLKVIWEHGPCTVRQVMERIEGDRPRAYTTVMSLMHSMHQKRLLRRSPHPRGKAFIYSAAKQQRQTVTAMLGDLVERAFGGSRASLVEHLLDRTEPSEQELEEIRRLIDEYRKKKESP